MAPPRGRKGETRMDAALDALVPMGFSKANIRTTVKDLLKLYGGAEAWVFLEEASYKLVIEALLGGEDESESGPRLLTNEAVIDDNMHGDNGSSSAPGAGHSSAAEAPNTCADCGSHQDSAVTDDSSFPQADFQSRRHHNSPLATLHLPPPPPEQEYVPPPPSLPPPPPPAGPAISPPKRKPCYGWWGDDSDDEIMYLPLMPVRPRACAMQQHRNWRA